MLAKLHRGYAALLTSGGQLLLLLIGVYFRTPTAWRVSLSLIAILSLLAWLAVLRRLRAFTDTPTSLVASAAQGYVELQGRGRPLDGLPVCSPINGLPCLWYRFKVERRSSDWQLVRAQARREVEQRRAEESRNRNDLHFMAKPGDGRLYLISALSTAKLARRYRFWAWAHVVIFLCALIGAAKIDSLGFPG